MQQRSYLKNNLYICNMENIQKYLNDDNVCAIYPLGSRVYGSYTDDSDYDYILICHEFFHSKDINVHVYTIEQYKQALNNHEIQALECYFIDDNLIVKYLDNTFDGLFNLDKSKLRISISTISSNSWVKGKKKLIIAGDYDPYLAIKSIFHSLRILDFGIQIGSTGSIINYGSMNWLLEDLKKMSLQYQRDELWNAIDTKYRSLYNEKSSQFKQLCPKALNENDMKKELRIILKNHKVTDGELNKILALFK